jgi:hypothetical protein
MRRAFIHELPGRDLLGNHRWIRPVLDNLGLIGKGSLPHRGLKERDAQVMDSRTGLALAGLLALTGCTSTGEQATGEETEESTKETEQATSEVTESEATTETTSTDPDEAILDRCRGRHDNVWRSGETLEEQVVGSKGYDPNDEPGNGMKFVALRKMRAEPERDWCGG